MAQMLEQQRLIQFKLRLQEKGQMATQETISYIYEHPKQKEKKKWKK